MKSSILVFLLLYIGLSAQGQSSLSKFKPGAKIGFNASYFTRDVDVFDEPDENFSSFKNSVRLSFMGGVTLDMEMTNKFTFGMELLYNSRGMGYSQKNNKVVIETTAGQTKDAYNNFEYQLDYLELPLTINYNFQPETSSKIVTGYLGFAPSLSIRKKSKLSYPKSDPDNDNQKTDLADVNSFMKSFLAGAKLGESYGDNELYMDLRAAYSPSKVFNRPINDFGKNLETHMFTFTLALGFKF